MIGLDDGSESAARTVVIATGARYRSSRSRDSRSFEGTSVYYAATLMEAQLCAGDPVVVVGGGNSAGQATPVPRRPRARVTWSSATTTSSRDMSRYLADRIERTPDVEVLPAHRAARAGRRATARGAGRRGHAHRRAAELEARALFVFIGAEPHTGWLGDQLALDERGFVLTGQLPAPSDGRAAAARDQPPGRVRRRATCAAAPSSGSPQRSARGPWRSAWCTSTGRQPVGMYEVRARWNGRFHASITPARRDRSRRRNAGR